MERKVGECYQWKAIGQCSKGDSCSFSHDRGSGNRCDHRHEGQSSSPAPKAQAHTDGKKPFKGSGRRGESPSGKEGRVACRHFLRGKCTNPSCGHWHPPVCLNYKSESGCTYGEKCRFRHEEVDGQPSEKSKKSGVKDQLPFWHVAPHQNSGKKGSIARSYSMVRANLMSAIRALPDLRKEHKTRKMRPQSSMELGETCPQAQ